MIDVSEIKPMTLSEMVETVRELQRLADRRKPPRVPIIGLELADGDEEKRLAAIREIVGMLPG